MSISHMSTGLVQIFTQAGTSRLKQKVFKNVLKQALKQLCACRSKPTLNLTEALILSFFFCAVNFSQPFFGHSADSQDEQIRVEQKRGKDKRSVGQRC